MRMNWAAYSYREFEGYGRYSTRLITALTRQGVEIAPLFAEHAYMPPWMQTQVGVSWDTLTLSCLPPYYLTRIPGRHWLLTMTEGSECPLGWADAINKMGVERVIVPCQHNAEAFRSGGVRVPIHVIPGGTDPDEFPLRPLPVGAATKPYTFLALADRGERKGFAEVYYAFYKAFGGKTTGQQDVRLIIKCRPDGNELIDTIRVADDPDARIVFWVEDVADAADIYRQADCFVIPSRSEGWGMPHREAAMMGIPVITQRYSGMDDGFTDHWATVLEKGWTERISEEALHIKGTWRRADTDELAAVMRAAYDDPYRMALKGREAAAWLRAHQTWDHAATALLALMQREGALEERIPDAARAEFV